MAGDDGIETITRGCPICHNDVKGDDVYLFFCKECNILFKRTELDMKGQVEKEVNHKIIKKYDRIKGKINTSGLKTLPLKKLPDEYVKVKIIKEQAVRKEIEYYFASKKSDKLHASNCPYGKNIITENRIIFKSLSEAKGYTYCRCLR